MRDRGALALIAAWVMLCLTIYSWTFTEDFRATFANKDANHDR